MVIHPVSPTVRFKVCWRDKLADSACPRTETSNDAQGIDARCVVWCWRGPLVQKTLRTRRVGSLLVRVPGCAHINFYDRTRGHAIFLRDVQRSPSFGFISFFSWFRWTHVRRARGNGPAWLHDIWWSGLSKTVRNYLIEALKFNCTLAKIGRGASSTKGGEKTVLLIFLKPLSPQNQKN